MNTLNISWDSWKRTLGQAVEYAEEMGITKEHLNSMAYQLGDILASSVPPANPEQKAVKELWEVADTEERQVLTNLMTKLASKK
ncbi:DUF3243 domain-containing protein [Pelotomaculum propionicicum]|uniref:DUF3243 domain-containing protein n=1 Tax=Pelotomaculum propionicicum TaxID=258475 RepID=A0A4Y7RXH5_9FIRM|nr:DUF3243 domain-containing protein [Pelotomaculum propionicicum]TEB13446.1 hypothetical protein Pmgp_00340 [Pelotomaculum propionicicum]